MHIKRLRPTTMMHPHARKLISLVSSLLVLTTFNPAQSATESGPLSQPARPIIEILEVLPEKRSAEAKEPTLPEQQNSTAPAPPQTSTRLSLTPVIQITNPRDAQPATPTLPEIGVFHDMPGTNGTVEFTRITEAASDNSRSHHYAKRSAIDPFDKYILFNDYLHHVSDMREFKRVPLNYEYVASQTQEDVFYGFYQRNIFSKWNAVTDEITQIYTAPSGMSEYTMGIYEGGMSWNDKYAVLTWNVNGGTQITIVNTETGRATGSIHSSAVDGGDRINWADISPSGKYVLIGMQRTVYRFENTLTGKTELNSRAGGSAHGDMMYDVAGNEVFVQEANFNHGQISYTELESNVHHTMSLVDTESQTGVAYANSASHISGQAINEQGFVLVSMQDTSGMFNMFGAYLVPGQSEVYQYGHTYTTGTSYRTEAKATINNSGQMVVWTSDWMGGGSTYEFLARIKK